MKLLPEETYEIQNVEGKGYMDRYPLLNINQLYNSCPDEIVIIVHGWSIDENNAKERFDRVKMSLESIEVLPSNLPSKLNEIISYLLLKISTYCNEFPNIVINSQNS